MAHAIDIADFTFRYGKEAPEALSHISLAIPAGSVCALLGPTNSGKTTMLHALSGILASHHRDSVSSGTMRIGDQIYTPLPPNVLFPAVGLTIQDAYSQVSGLRETVSDEVMLTLETLGTPMKESRRTVDSLLLSLGLSHLAQRKPSTLSGGELQRIAMATILVAQPPVLLMDEPCNSLDGTAQHRLRTVVHSLKDRTTVVIADYQLEFALGTADQFVVLDSGRIVFSGNRQSFIDRLVDFTQLLPTEEWVKTRAALKESKSCRRIEKVLGFQ